MSPGSRTTGYVNLSQASGQAEATRRIAQIGAVGGFALLAALAAQVYIPLAHTPVPITLQSAVALLAGLAIGPRLGAISMAVYWLLGAVGYAVWAAGTAGLEAAFGATGGYLIGFVIAAYVAGRLSAAEARGSRRLLVAALGTAVIFLCGGVWLSWTLGVGVAATLSLGVWPFVPGAALKLALVALLADAWPARWRQYLAG